MTKEEYKVEAMSMIELLAKKAKKKQLSFYRIAKETGLSESTVGRILTGKFIPSLDNYIGLKKIIDG